jgi:hypothetical protein
LCVVVDPLREIGIFSVPVFDIKIYMVQIHIWSVWLGSHHSL